MTSPLVCPACMLVYKRDYPECPHCGHRTGPAVRRARSVDMSDDALDRAVALALGVEPGADYSTNWCHAGPLIERYHITLVAHEGEKWSATVERFSYYIDERLPFESDYAGADGSCGPTALVAAMRALVRKHRVTT